LRRRSGRRRHLHGAQLRLLRARAAGELAHRPRPALAALLGPLPRGAGRPGHPRGRAAVRRLARPGDGEPVLLSRRAGRGAGPPAAPGRGGARRRVPGARRRRARAVMSGAVVWITGLPASGKSTLAARARDELARRGRPAALLDGDRMRPILGPELGYAPDERDELYRRLAALAVLLAEQGLLVLVPATAPQRRHRDR